MPDFLLEIGCEEIPARMLENAYRNLRRQVAGLVFREKLFRLPPEEMPEGRFQVFATPRRLALLFTGLESRQPDVEEEVTGPSVKVAFKDGQPTPAAHAFAKKVGIEVSKLDKVINPKGEYLAAKVNKKGLSAEEVFLKFLPNEIASLYWPKNMYWRSGKPEEFVRPVRWIVALLDGRVLPIEFGGVKGGAVSRGHRILGSGEISIPLPVDYPKLMFDGSVIVDVFDRHDRIRKALDAATRTIPGARWREDPELLNTVINLTEWPSAILGNFDPQFLSLPEEVLVTVMRDHQKYFAVEDASGKLTPHFLAVLNTDRDPDGLIRHGNERVLRARFNDAQFFWDFDNRTDFRQRRELLKHVTFQKELGNYFDKTERVAQLVSEIGKFGVRFSSNMAEEGARLCKNDLTTELVKEFTELQGIVGGRYAAHQGLPPEVANAIYDHYKPVSMEDSAPRSLEGAAVSIADKADSIAGMFALGLAPTGSKDPFSLRRQANGIVKTLADHKLTLDLARLMREARKGYQGSEAEKKFSLNGEAYTAALSSFFKERLEFYLRDNLGIAYDVVNATLAADASDVPDAIARAQAVTKVRPSADFESISVAFKRMKNILRQAAENNRRIANPFDPALLREDQEKKLAGAVPRIKASVNQLRDRKEYEAALLEISKLRPLIDGFFDKVMVMVEDEHLRAHRLGLLQTLVREFSSIADFSEIVNERK